MTALSPVQNTGICQDVLSFPVMEEAQFLPCGREGVELLWSSHARASYFREWAAAAPCSGPGQQRVQVPGWSWADPHTSARPASCSSAEERAFVPAIWLPESRCVCKYPLHHFCAQHRMVFSVFLKSAFNPQTLAALLLHSTHAILTSTHTDSHRIRRTTAFTM